MATTNSLSVSDRHVSNPLNLDLELGPHPASELEDNLFSTFLQYLPAHSDVSVAAAAKQIDTLLVAHQDGAGFLHVFWEMYFRLGCQIDDIEVLRRLVTLASELKELPTMVVFRVSEKPAHAWSTLPIMGMELTERWHRKCFQANHLLWIVLRHYNKREIKITKKKKEVPVN